MVLVLRKSIKYQEGKVIGAKEITTKEDLQNLKRAKEISEFWLLLKQDILVQQDEIQREVSRWFTYLIDRKFSCINEKLASYGALIVKYVNRASFLFTGAHAFHIVSVIANQILSEFSV